MTENKYVRPSWDEYFMEITKLFQSVLLVIEEEAAV